MVKISQLRLGGATKCAKTITKGLIKTIGVACAEAPVSIFEIPIWLEGSHRI
jgi:hypothetical protein